MADYGIYNELLKLNGNVTNLETKVNDIDVNINNINESFQQPTYQMINVFIYNGNDIDHNITTKSLKDAIRNHLPQKGANNNGCG